MEDWLALFARDLAPRDELRKVGRKTPADTLLRLESGR
jgi:hypothetical protein